LKVLGDVNDVFVAWLP